MELIFSKKFQKNARKLVESRKNLKDKINKALIDFSKLGRQANCYRKKLRGRFIGYEELEIGGDLRIIVRIDKDNSKAVLENIGTHSELGL